MVISMTSEAIHLAAAPLFRLGLRAWENAALPPESTRLRRRIDLLLRREVFGMHLSAALAWLSAIFPQQQLAHHETQILGRAAKVLEHAAHWMDAAFHTRRWVLHGSGCCRQLLNDQHKAGQSECR
jgi:hypothetical protein